MIYCVYFVTLHAFTLRFAPFLPADVCVAVDTLIYRLRTRLCGYAFLFPFTFDSTRFAVCSAHDLDCCGCAPFTHFTHVCTRCFIARMPAPVTLVVVVQFTPLLLFTLFPLIVVVTLLIYVYVVTLVITRC